MHWDFALILISLGVAVPFAGRRRIRHLLSVPETTRIDRLTLYASTIAFQSLAAGVVLWRTSARAIRPSQLGLTLGQINLTITITVVVTYLLLINQLVSLRKVASHPAELGGVLAQLALKVFPRDNLERLAFFALVATVAVCEETIYRGFAQDLFENWSRSTVIGVVASAVLFSLAHLYQGRRGLVSTFTIGLLFSGIRAWTGSLIPSIAAHFAADLAAGLLAPARIRAALRASAGAEPSPAHSVSSEAS
jgi:membrane protease YdiL (CAAX protease family)